MNRVATVALLALVVGLALSKEDVRGHIINKDIVAHIKANT